MKVKRLFLFLLITMLGTTACGSGGDKGSSVDGNLITDWTAATKTSMQSTLGKVLPVAPLTPAYEIEVNVYDYFGTLIEISDAEVGNKVAAYGTILSSAGYQKVLEDNDYLQYFFEVNTNNRVFVDVYYDSDVMCVDAILQTMITTWSNSDTAAFNTALGTVIPVLPMSVNYYFEADEWEDGTKYVAISDLNLYYYQAFDPMERTDDLLLAAGFAYDGTNPNDYYEMYSKAVTGGDLIVEIGYDEDYGFDVWLYVI